MPSKYIQWLSDKLLQLGDLGAIDFDNLFVNIKSSGLKIGNKTVSVDGDKLSDIVIGGGGTYKIARGNHTMLSASDTVVSGLATVVAVVVSLQSDPILTCDRTSASVGNQVGAPAAGSFYCKVWMPTDSTLTTPIAATGYANIVVNWIAIGT